MLLNRFGKMDALPGIVGPEGRHVGLLIHGQDGLLRKEPGLSTVEVGPDFSSSPSRVWGLDMWVVMSAVGAGVPGSAMESPEQSTRCGDQVPSGISVHRHPWQGGRLPCLCVWARVLSTGPRTAARRRHLLGRKQRTRTPESSLLNRVLLLQKCFIK